VQKKEYRKRAGSLRMPLTECDMRQKGKKRKRGKNIYHESSEFQADTDDSISRQVFAAVSCLSNSQVMEMAVSYTFLLSLSSDECKAKDEVVFIQTR